MISRQVRQYLILMRLHKPIGIFLLLWPTLWALCIASEGQPDPWVAIVFILGVILMRSAGCVINDYADMRYDPHVQRTRNRPLATGRVKPKEALILFAALVAVAFVLVLTLNWLTIGLSLVAGLLAATYPYMKRHTYLPQVYLGLAFGWAVPMSFAAQTGGVPLAAWLLLIATVLWTTAYDTIYAMVDRADDLRIGVRSTAILFGDADRLIIAVIQVTTVLALIFVGQHLELGGRYYSGVAVAAVFMAYQQYLIRDRDGMQCYQAFLNNNWVGAAVFAGIIWQYL